MTIALIAYFFSFIALWGSLLIFGVWAYRKFQFRSLPWLAAFLVLTLVLTFVGKFSNHYFQDHPPSVSPLFQYLSNGDTLGNTFSFLSHWAAFASNLAYLLLAILVFSDLVLLLSNAGIDVMKDKLGERLIQVRQKSTVLGIAMLLLKIVPSVGLVLLFSSG